MPNKLRVILDNNLWISYLISKRLKRIDELFAVEGIVLLFSEELLTEFLEVVSRPKFTKYFSQEDVDELLSQFDSYGELVSVSSQIEICRDEKDNFLLALAKDGQADFLVTGDKDLLDISKLDATQIVTYTQFEELA